MEHSHQNVPSPPSSNAYRKRDNPPNTAFRRFYERGDLPVLGGAQGIQERYKMEGISFLYNS